MAPKMSCVVGVGGGFVLAAALFFGAPGLAFAAPSRSQSSWELDGERVQGWFWSDAAALESFGPGSSRRAPAELATWLAEQHVLDGLAISVDGQQCQAVAAATSDRAHLHGGLFSDFAFRCPESGQRARVRIDAYFDRRLAHGHLASFRVVATGESFQVALGPVERGVVIPLGGGGLGSRAKGAVASVLLLLLASVAATAVSLRRGARSRRARRVAAAAPRA